MRLIPGTIRGRLLAGFTTLFVLLAAFGGLLLSILYSQSDRFERTIADAHAGIALSQSFVSATYAQILAGRVFAERGTLTDSMEFERAAAVVDSIRELMMRPRVFGLDELAAIDSLAALNERIQIRLWQARIALRNADSAFARTITADYERRLGGVALGAARIRHHVERRAREREALGLRDLREARSQLIAGCLGIAGLLLLTAIVLWLSVTRPLRSFVEEVEALGRGDVPVARPSFMPLPARHEYARLRRAIENTRTRLDGFISNLARLAAVVRNAGDSILILDDDCVIEDANAAAEHLFGRTRDAVIGRPLHDVLVSPQRGALESAIADATATHQPMAVGVTTDFLVVRPDTALTCEVMVTPIGEASSGRIALIMRDLTQRRVMEERLRQSERLAAVARVVGGIAHELNNPLAAILLTAEGMSASPPASKGEDIETIRAMTHRAARIVADLLSFIEEMPLRRHPVPVARFVSDLQAGLESIVNSLGASLRIATVPAVDVLGDVRALRQAFENVIINGAQAAGPGGTVSVTFAVENDVLLARVSDTGTGVPEAVAPRIFEPFFTTRGRGSGVGLGLSVARGILQQHRGSIALDRNPAGATFVLTLPIIDQAVESQGTEQGHEPGTEFAMPRSA